MSTTLREPASALCLALRSAADGGDDLRYLHHLHALLLVLEAGHPCCQVARWLGCSTRTVERWVRAYLHGGVEPLHPRHGGGRHAQLTEHQATALRAELAEGPQALGYDYTRWSGKLLLRHLASRHGLHLGLRQCQRMLRQALAEAPPPAADSRSVVRGAPGHEARASRPRGRGRV